MTNAKKLRFLSTPADMVAAIERGETTSLESSPVEGSPKLHDVRVFWTETGHWTALLRVGPVQFRRILAAAL